jgi:hypothetical protein
MYFDLCGGVEYSSGQDSGELFKEFGFEAEPGLRTFQMLIATIFCNFIGKLRGGHAYFEISQVCERAIGAGKRPPAPPSAWQGNYNKKFLAIATPILRG